MRKLMRDAYRAFVAAYMEASARPYTFLKAEEEPYYSPCLEIGERAGFEGAGEQPGPETSRKLGRGEPRTGQTGPLDATLSARVWQVLRTLRAPVE